MTVYAITDTKKGRTGIAPTYLQTTQRVQFACSCCSIRNYLLLWFIVAVVYDRYSSRDNEDVSFGGVRWHCSPAMSVILGCILFQVHSSNNVLVLVQ